MLYLADISYNHTIDNPYQLLRGDGVKTMQSCHKNNIQWKNNDRADADYRRGQDYNCYEITEDQANKVIERWKHKKHKNL